jgi:hypothetical protein
MKINIPYNFGDVVYCKNDENQDECMITEFKILPNNVLKLTISYCGDTCEVYDFEISKDKDISKALNFDETKED